MENDEKSDIKPKERIQNKNLKRDAGPGRPPKQRNYATIYREALMNIAKANDKTPEEIEEMLEVTGLKKALKGDFNFWKDVRDRIHGKPQQNVDHTTDGKALPTPIIPLNVQPNNSNEPDRIIE